MTFRSADEIDGALQRLGKRLLYDYAEPISAGFYPRCGRHFADYAQPLRKRVTMMEIDSILSELQQNRG